MGIESNKEAVAMMKNALGSIENRFREAYNKGYKDGIKEGINQAMRKIADSILEEVEADRKTENCSEIPNNSTCSKMEQVDKDINVRSKDEPQTEMTTEQIVNELLSIKKILDDGKMPKQRCGNCKHLTYRWNKTWCDIKCDNPHDMVCDKWERSE